MVFLPSKYKITRNIKLHFDLNKQQKKITLNIVAITFEQLQFWVYKSTTRTACV